LLCCVRLPRRYNCFVLPFAGTFFKKIAKKI
jgi:hypothetical protein